MDLTEDLIKILPEPYGSKLSYVVPALLYGVYQTLRNIPYKVTISRNVNTNDLESQ